MLLNFIDNYLIEFWFQPFAHKFQKLTGKDNFSLSYHCCFIFWIAINITCVLGKASWLILLIINFISADHAVLIFLINWKYKKESVAKEVLHQNSYRLNWGAKLKRTVLFVLGSIMLAEIVFSAPRHFCRGETLIVTIICSFVSLHYFIACTPLPPQSGLIKKWFRAGIEFTRNLGSRSGEPIPVPG